jgi:hypothetical protein
MMPGIAGKAEKSRKKRLTICGEALYYQRVA